MKRTLILLIIITFNYISFSQSEEESVNVSMEELQEYIEYRKFADSIDSTFVYQHGKVLLGDGIASLQVPEGYKFLNSTQSEYVLSDLWGNPPEEVLGMLFREEESPMDETMSFAIEISYDEAGYVSDEDAEEIDYDELLEEMQKDEILINKERVAGGYEEMHLVGWASAPYYDAQAKKLHWAKELHFGEAEYNTLNYNIRVLGRKGYLILNAIGDIEVLSKFNEDRDRIIESVEFEDGYKYSEFDPGIDEVAAYGIGGLVAGKVLAKAGFFALLLKFWKIIAIGVVGFFAAFKNRLFKKKENLPSQYEE